MCDVLPLCGEIKIKKGKVFQYSFPSVGPGADPCVQAVSLQVTEKIHPPGGRLPLLFARLAVTSVAFTRWRHTVAHIRFQLTTHLSTTNDERLSWRAWLTCSGRFTHSSGHPSAAGRVQDRESSPARDRSSATVLRNRNEVRPYQCTYCSMACSSNLEVAASTAAA